ncbi:Rap30/74 interaction domain-containing protein [Lactarius hengduanensis]|nr:Rap30/74 interaction domain-containing protein [Lactarius hengduanensis]
MAPAPPGAAKLFHPKTKKKGPVGIYGMHPRSTSQPKTPPNPSTPPAKPSPKPEPEAATASLPEGPYTDYTLVSSALNGWKYDVMKFDARKPVDILRWAAPVKLNRKDLRRPDTSVSGPEAPRAVGPMLGPDGKPVIGMDGRIVMVDAEGKPIHGDGTPGSTKNKNGGGPRRKFQKKTKQVFKVPEATRQLRKEERYPWVMEDATGSEVWVGKMEEAAKAETQAFFMPASNNTFKFVPAHRWYKFQKKPNYHIPNLEEAESLMAMRQRNKDPERWLLQKRNGQGPSAATSALLKGESPEGSIRGAESLGPGGRRLRTVVNGSAGLFGDEDEDGGSRGRDLGQDADFDEVPYHEDFADDEEKVLPEDHQEDELEKEMEERLQREYMTANKQRDAGVDESDDDDHDPALTGAGKAIKKLMSKHEKNDAYDSDDESNPYASSVEEEEEDEPMVADGPAVQQQFTPTRAPSNDATSAPSQATLALPSRPAATSTPNSRATSPTPGHGGHLVVAKRATSPKAPKPRVMPNGVRASSPLALVIAGSPNGTDAVAGHGGSPGPSQPTRASPTVPSAKLNHKRKADEADEAVSAPSPTTSLASGQPKPKKRRATAAMLGPDGQPIELEDNMVVEWLRNTPNAKTRDCISHFTPYLRTDEQKAKFTSLIKEVAQLKNGILVLRSAYRVGGGSKASSPSPMDTK